MKLLNGQLFCLTELMLDLYNNTVILLSVQYISFAFDNCVMHF